MPLLFCCQLLCACRATDAINASLGTDKVEFMELDVGSFEKIRSFVSKFKAKKQPIHILVNNAGADNLSAFHIIHLFKHDPHYTSSHVTSRIMG